MKNNTPGGQKLQISDDVVVQIPLRFTVGDRVIEKLSAGADAPFRETTIVAADDRVCLTAEGNEYDALTGGRLDRKKAYTTIRLAPTKKEVES